MKATTTITAQPGTTASRTPRQEGIIKEAIGLTDVKTLRARARQGIEDGAMTAGYKAKAETVITLLNDALATEIVCVLRYKRHYFMATGISSLSVKGEFLKHAAPSTYSEWLRLSIPSGERFGSPPSWTMRSAN